MFEALVLDKKTQTPDSGNKELMLAEKQFDQATSHVKSECEKIEQFDELNKIEEILKSVDSDGTSLLTLLKPSLEAIGVDCDNKEAALEGIGKIISTVGANISNEASLEGIIGSLFSTADYVDKLSKQLSSVVLQDPSKDLSDFDVKVDTITSDQFLKLIPAYTKCIDVIVADGQDKKLSSKSLEKVTEIMKGIGLVIENGSWADKKAYDKFDSKKQTLKEAGWTKEKTSKAIVELIQLSKALGKFGKLDRAVLKGGNTAGAAKETSPDSGTRKAIYDQKKVIKDITRFSKLMLQDIKAYAKDLKYVVSAFQTTEK